MDKPTWSLFIRTSFSMIFMAKTFPVSLYLTRRTSPKAPRPMVLSISKSESFIRLRIRRSSLVSSRVNF